MFRSCGRWLVLYVVLAALAAALIYARFPRLPVALGAGAVAGGLIWMSIASIGGMGAKSAEARLIRRARNGGRPSDGEKVAVIGTVSGGMDALESPITRRRCMAYEYKVLEPGRETAATYEGFALAPLTIDGPRGAIRLLAVPELAFPEERPEEPEHLSNLKEYIDRTTWKVHEGIDLKREFAFLKNVLADDDGRIRYDVRREAAPENLELMKLSEKTLAAGEKIVAIGRFSSARGGLVPDPKALMYPVKILKGDVDEVLRKSGSRVTDLAMSCGCLIPVIVAALIALTVVPLAAIEQMIPTKDPSWIEVRLERFIDRNVRSYFPKDQVAIEISTGEARGRLNDIRLHTASATREDNATDVTLTSEDGHAGVVLRFRGERLQSARVIGDGAIPENEIDVEQLDTADGQITGRVTYLSKDLNLRATFRAMIE
jgi:hypothetical protein